MTKTYRQWRKKALKDPEVRREYQKITRPTDKQRLDFLIKNGSQFLEEGCEGGCCTYWPESIKRSDIDAAIRASRRRKGKA